MSVSAVFALADSCQFQPSLHEPLGDGQQRAFFDSLACGVMWILPHSQSFLYYTPSAAHNDPSQDPALVEYVPLVQWTERHCEPLALKRDGLIRPAGLMTMPAMLSMLKVSASSALSGFTVIGARDSGSEPLPSHCGRRSFDRCRPGPTCALGDRRLDLCDAQCVLQSVASAISQRPSPATDSEDRFVRSCRGPLRHLRMPPSPRGRRNEHVYVAGYVGYEKRHVSRKYPVVS